MSIFYLSTILCNPKKADVMPPHLHRNHRCLSLFIHRSYIPSCNYCALFWRKEDRSCRYPMFLALPTRLHALSRRPPPKRQLVYIWCFICVSLTVVRFLGGVVSPTLNPQWPGGQVYFLSGFLPLAIDSGSKGARISPSTISTQLQQPCYITRVPTRTCGIWFAGTAYADGGHFSVFIERTSWRRYAPLRPLTSLQPHINFYLYDNTLLPFF